MAGLSLRCGDCGLQLRSVEEAQEHAELSGHANFSESTEAVLNLVCAECGKPCRSKTETDLHTKRTGHTQFQDKTLEAAKPVVLEVPKQPTNSETPESQDAEEGELVVPEVNKDLLAELEGMGFSNGKSIRALYVSGASDLETAINWIVEHENDPDIDEIPRVSAKQASKQKIALAPEEAKAKLQELRERAKKKKEEEERRMEREREKERIRIGKELLEAKRKEEDNERQRILMMRKAEKEEEKRAREKIRKKLEEDKAERRRKLGLPAEDPKPAASVAPVVEKKSALPIKPASRAEQMRDCLRIMKQVYKDDDAKVKKAFQTLLTFVGNVVRSPDEEKYRKIRLSNQSFQERVGTVEGGLKFLELCGFEKDQVGEFIFLSRDKVDVVLLNTAGGELNSAITNPFFGVL